MYVSGDVKNLKYDQVRGGELKKSKLEPSLTLLIEIKKFGIICIRKNV